jgi:tetratricopeptide (TPR) repeat protein
VKRLISKNPFKPATTVPCKKLFVFLLFPFYFSLFILSAQDRRIIDSLQNELRQYDSHKKELGNNANSLTDTLKVKILYGLAFQYWGADPDSCLYYANQVMSLSQQTGYKKGVGDVYNVMGLLNMALKNYAVAEDYYQKALKIRTEIGDKTGLAWTYNNMGLMYGNMGENEESIKCHLRSLKIKEELGDKVGMGASYGKIGHDYASVGKFPEAVNYYLKALKMEEETGDKTEICSFYGDIGGVYYNEGNYPEALKNYTSQLKAAFETGDKIRIGYAEMNMGSIYNKQGNDTGAIRYIRNSLKIFEAMHDQEDDADAQYNLGLLYIAMGNYALAISIADSSLKQFQSMGIKFSLARGYIEVGSIYEKLGKLQVALDTVMKGLNLSKQIGARVEVQDAYANLINIHSEMGNYKAAVDDYKEYITNLDSISSSESVKKISVMEMNYAFNKREDSIKAAQEKENIIKTAESNRKTIITGSSIVISIFALLMAFLLVNRQQIKRRKDKIIFEKETNLLLLEKQKMEDELAKAKSILDDYIVTMMEKNALLEQFKLDVENLKNLKAREIDETRVENLEHLNKTTILTDDDWNKFKELFEQAYKGFFIRQKEKLPGLTQAEIRLLCLTKLKLDTKQMGGILGVSFDTIKKSRHRLRKKLGLAEEDSIEEVAEAI